MSHADRVTESAWRSVRYAARSLRNAPAFTVAAVLTLSIGIGASTAIFSMVNGVLVRRLPTGSGNRLVHLMQPSAASPNDGFSVSEVKDLDRQLQTMRGVAEYHSMSFQLYGHGDPLRVQTGVVSDKFFDLIGVRPVIGRTFRAGEEAIGAPPVVVLSHRFWMDQFHGDPAIVGASFTMNDRVHHVVGVLPALPGYPDDNDIWMPAGACPFRSAPMMMNDRGMRMVEAFGVLKSGVSLERAAAELTAVGSRYRVAFPAAYPPSQRLRFAAGLARDEMQARARPVLLMLMATAAFLLLAAIANVANLSLTRQMRRGRELAVRVALGASRARLYRQLALESGLLTLVGGFAGLLMAASSIGLLRTFATRFTPRAGEIQLDAPVVGFALVLCIGIALVIAAAPFLHLMSHADLSASLRSGGSGSVGGAHDLRVRRVLVAAQVAIACVILVGAGLIGRSLMRLERVDAGVDVSNVLTGRVTLNFTKYGTNASQRHFADALLQRLNGVPGATTVALASALPLNTGQPMDVAFQISGSPTAKSARGPHGDMTAISPDYFQAVGIPLLRGNAFTSADRDTANMVAIVSRSLVQPYWGARDPIGTRITPDSGKHWLRIVGVAGDVRQKLTDAGVSNEIYVPILANGTGDVRVFIRASSPAAAMPPLVRALRAAVHDVDDHQPLSSVQTLDEVRGAQLAEPRLTATLLSAFAALALVLTATGLAGVIGYGVSQRLPEIAIRMALGAERGRVTALVLRDGLSIVVIGLIVGLGLSALGGRLIGNLLFNVSQTDVGTYVMVPVVIIATAAVACLAPTRRALRTDPARAMRGG